MKEFTEQPNEKKSTEIDNIIAEEEAKKEERSQSAAVKRREDQLKLYRGPHGKWVLGYNRPHAGKDN